MTEDVLALTAQIVSAHVKRNPIGSGELPVLIRDVFRTLSGLGGTRAVAEEAAEPEADPSAKPAVPATKSVFQDYIICMECGKRMTMLKRHLTTEHGLSIEQYRSKYGLPGSYPMVAPKYAQTRSSLAKEMGLGKSRTVMSKKGGRRK